MTWVVREGSTCWWVVLERLTVEYCNVSCGELRMGSFGREDGRCLSCGRLGLSVGYWEVWCFDEETYASREDGWWILESGLFASIVGLGHGRFGCW